MTTAIRIENLRRRVTIQIPTETVGARGGVSSTWATFKTRWAEVKPLSGSEDFREDRNRAVTAVQFTIRYVAGITNKMRISWNSRLYDIQSIINIDERNHWIRLITEETETTS